MINGEVRNRQAFSAIHHSPLAFSSLCKEGRQNADRRRTNCRAFGRGIATSIKSIDLNAATYQDAARLTYRLNEYIDKLGEYQGGSLLTTTVELSDISDRVLNLVIPKGAMTEIQGAAIEAARARALIASRYPVKIIITPL